MFPGLYADLVMRGTIELKRAELILRARNTAVRNIKRVKFDLHSDERVREISDYPAPPRSKKSTRPPNPQSQPCWVRPRHCSVSRRMSGRAWRNSLRAQARRMETPQAQLQ